MNLVAGWRVRKLKKPSKIPTFTRRAKARVSIVTLPPSEIEIVCGNVWNDDTSDLMINQGKITAQSPKKIM